jgi:hypothetical protein
MANSPPLSPGARQTQDVPRSYLLELPTELRLHIYDYALADSESVTITSATVLDEAGECLDSTTSFSSISDLPEDHVPLIKSLHDPSILSITTPPTIRSPASSFASLASSRTSIALETPIDEPDSVSAAICLRRTCRYINEELSAHLSHRLTTKSTLHINYPYGLLVLKDRCPHLLHQAKEVHIYGAYALEGPVPRPTPICPRHQRSNRRQQPPVFPKVSQTVKEAASSALTSLVRTILSPVAHPSLQKLEMRVFYPDEDAYNQVWSDDLSPIVVALQNTCGGKIDMVCWRGRKGTGLHLITRPNPEQRVVSTVWKRMSEWGTAGPDEDCEQWVVGERESSNGNPG